MGLSIIKHPFGGTPILGNPHLIHGEIPSTGAFRLWNPRPVARHAFYAARTVWPLDFGVRRNCETTHQPLPIPRTYILVDSHVVEIWIPSFLPGPPEREP